MLLLCSVPPAQGWISPSEGPSAPLSDRLFPVSAVGVRKRPRDLPLARISETLVPGTRQPVVRFQPGLGSLKYRKKTVKPFGVSPYFLWKWAQNRNCRFPSEGSRFLTKGHADRFTFRSFIAK